MSWKHIVVEGYCLYEGKKGVVPKCCNYKPGIIGLHCLVYDEIQHKHCPYFAFGKARTSSILTGKDGEVIAFKTFSCDSIDEDEWLEKENIWITKWKQKFEK